MKTLSTAFAALPQVRIPRSSFPQKSTYTTTLDASKVNCVGLFEVIPGDTLNFNLKTFVRMLSPLKSPMLSNLRLKLYAISCPIRHVYADYEKFFGSTKGPEGNWEFDDSHFLPKVLPPAGGWPVGSLADQFGIPTGVPNLPALALPFRAYNLSIAQWFRPSSYDWVLPTVKRDSTDDDPALYEVLKGVKRADGFTACLPSTQHGPGISIPLGAFAPVVTRSDAADTSGDGISLVWSNSTTGSLFVPSTAGDVGFNSNQNQSFFRPAEVGVKGSTKLKPRNLWADMSDVTSTSILQLRQAFQLQSLCERDLQAGLSYKDQLWAHWGVVSPDARLQRTELLGVGTVPVQIHTVANTAGGSDVQASLAAYAVGGDSSSLRFIKSFDEHGYVLILAKIETDQVYQQGLPKLFDRFARFDFYYPEFSHIGDQVVKNKEIFAQGDDVLDTDGAPIDEKPFGYQERYFEYRYGKSQITGELRSQFAQSLDSWHLAQKFNNLPTLSEQFLLEDVPMSRIKAVVDGPDFLYDSLLECNWVRPMSLYSIPGFGSSL